MSYWEDRYIEYLGFGDGQFGASPGDTEARLRGGHDMIPNDQPARKEMIERVLQYLKGEVTLEDGRYTTWESEFVESVFSQFSSRGDLSNKQCEILEKIYDK